MKRVPQRHKLGCVSASLAMVAGISYTDSLKLIHPRRVKGTKVFSNLKRLYTVLQNLKLNPEINFKPDIRNIKYPSIIILFPDNKMGHAVVWDPKSKKILDPQLTKPNHLSYYKKYFKLALEIRTSS